MNETVMATLGLGFILGLKHATEADHLAAVAAIVTEKRSLWQSAVVGGLWGRTSLGLLRVERFFLPEDLRRGRLGSRILAMAEDEGRRRGCTRAVLSTLHFQAPGFYLKQGWEVAARIDCEPPGHTRFYMTKKLS